MRPEFLRDGKFYRSAVVTEVLTGRLTRTEIEQLANDPDMKTEFFGELAPYVRPQKEWDELYLDKLSCVAAGECFNVEYLLYLEDVNDYVTKAPYRRRRKFSIAGAILIVVGVIVWLIATKWNVS